MSTADINKLGLILAVQAEIEGMKAYNAGCVLNEDGRLYSEESFYDKAQELRDIVNKPHQSSLLKIKEILNKTEPYYDIKRIREILDKELGEDIVNKHDEEL